VAAKVCLGADPRRSQYFTSGLAAQVVPLVMLRSLSPAIADLRRSQYSLTRIDSAQTVFCLSGFISHHLVDG
jgi:hypothetical protein